MFCMFGICPISAGLAEYVWALLTICARCLANVQYFGALPSIFGALSNILGDLSIMLGLCCRAVSNCCAARRGEGGKPQQTIQRPNRLYKAPTDYTKPQKIIQKKMVDKPKTIKQRHALCNNNLNILTRVTINMNLTYNITDSIAKTQSINWKGDTISKNTIN